MPEPYQGLTNMFFQDKIGSITYRATNAYLSTLPVPIPWKKKTRRGEY
jgi:hypothetical protein